MQISFDRLFAKIAIFSRKTCAIRFLKSKAFQKAKFYQNLTSENGQNKELVCCRQKQSFRQLVLKPGFKPKGGALGM